MSEYLSESQFLGTLLRVVRERWLYLVTVFAVTLLCLCLISTAFKVDTASTTISMNYSGIEKGQNPNGSRFSMNSIISDEVIERAIEYAGLEDMVTVEYISSCLGINTLSARNSADGYYFSTSYRLTYTQPREVAHYLNMSADYMLALIRKAYKDVFYEQYTTDNYEMIDTAIVDVDTLDYDELRAYYNLKATQLNNFLTIRMEQNDSFTSSVTNETFRSLQQRVYNLINYKIADFKAYVLENGVVSDYDHHVSTLKYKNFDIDQGYQKDYRSYDTRKNIIEEYDNAMSGVVLVPTYDQTREFYMSRTKIGIDYLASDSDANLVSAQWQLLSIDTNDDRLDKLIRNNSQAVYDTADRMSDEISKELANLIDVIKKTDKDYVMSTSRNYFIFQNSYTSFLDKIEKKQSLLGAFCMTMLLLFCYCVRYGVIHKESGR